jgi:hemoglobin
MNDGQAMHLGGDSPITEAMIRRLVETFYAKVREDELIGPIFNARVADWDDHLTKLTAFWASVVLRKPGYDGRPMRPHLIMPLEGRHFDRWLDLFETNALAELPNEIAAVFIDRARRIADSFELGVAGVRGEIGTPRHLKRPAV